MILRNAYTFAEVPSEFEERAKPRGCLSSVHTGSLFRYNKSRRLKKKEETDGLEGNLWVSSFSKSDGHVKVRRYPL